MAEKGVGEGSAADGGVPAGERRIVGRALARWERLRAGRRFPTRDDCIAPDQADLAPNIFIIAAATSEDGDEIVRCGPVFRAALGRDPVGCKAIEVLPSATERRLSFCRVAIELKKPIADVGRFTNAEGEEIEYRSILLPLSDDQEHVNYLLGAFNYRVVH